MIFMHTCASAQLCFRFLHLKSLSVSRRAMRACALLLIPALFVNSMSYAATPADTPPAPEIIHQQVQHRGLNKDVKLVRKDGTEVKGRIALIGEVNVTIQVKKSASPVVVPYAEVAAVKGPGLSRGAKIGIGIGAGLVVTVGIAAIIIDHELSKPWGPI